MHMHMHMHMHTHTHTHTHMHMRMHMHMLWSCRRARAMPMRCPYAAYSMQPTLCNLLYVAYSM